MAIGCDTLPDEISATSALDEGIAEFYTTDFKQWLQMQLPSAKEGRAIGCLIILITLGIIGYIGLNFLIPVLVVIGAVSLWLTLGILISVIGLLVYFWPRNLKMKRFMQGLKSQSLAHNYLAIGDTVLDRMATGRGWQKKPLDYVWHDAVLRAYPFPSSGMKVVYAYEHPEQGISLVGLAGRGQGIPIMMIRIPCHKPMQGITVAVMDMGWMKHGGGDLRWPLKRVRLVSSQFENIFEVFSTSQVEGWDMMSPDIMQRLLDHVDEQLPLTALAYPLNNPGELNVQSKGGFGRLIGLFKTPMLVFTEGYLHVLYRHPIHPFYPQSMPGETDPGDAIRRLWRRLRLIEGLKQFYFPYR
jgi:hypothetical protein